jgi:uncharacterized protein (TIGR00251 family)
VADDVLPRVTQSSEDIYFMLSLEQTSLGVVLPIRAHAGARRNAILGEREGALRIAVTTAPEKGKANQAIIALLSKSLGISKSAIELISGETSPKKRVLVTDMDMDQCRQVLDRILEQCEK